MLTSDQIADALLSPLGFARVMKPDWLDNWHQHSINDALERVFIGQCKRLIINVPPRSGKTEIAVKNFVAWASGHYPDSEWIHASYSKRLAARNTYDMRNYMLDPRYKEIFPALSLRDDGKAKDEFYTTAGGVVYATGAGGTITGYGAGKKRDGFGGAVIIDDPLKADDAHSETMRENVNEWYLSTMQSRLNHPDTPVIIIMQRLHENDLTGFLLNGGSGEVWEHISIPALDAQDQSFWEAQLPTERLHQMRTANSMIFAGQYMQSPAPLEGGIFKVVWFEDRHAYVAPFHGFDQMIISADTAFKAGELNDPSCFTVWGVRHNVAHLLDCINKRLEFPELVSTAKQLGDMYSPTSFLIEDKGSGQSLIQELRTNTRLPIVAINTPARKSKEERVLQAVQSSGSCEAGRIKLPRHAHWLHEVEKQLFFFPNATHDDIVDSVSQFVNWWRDGQDEGYIRMMQGLLNGL